MERTLYDLAPATRWVGRRMDIHDEVDSTNLIAETLAGLGVPEGTLVVADRQTAGRGRMGRSFFSPGGSSIYMSLVLRPDCRAEDLHMHVFAAAVAVAETAAPLLSDGAVEIKWPNDVLLGGRKTSGINLPARLNGQGVEFAVLGVGVNINTQLDDFPPELHEIATSLRIASGREIDRIGFAEALLARLEQEIERMRSEGFKSVLDCWRRYFRMAGARVRIGGPGVSEIVEGVVQGIDEQGALLLSVGSGSRVRIERIIAGDVTLLRSEG